MNDLAMPENPRGVLGNNNPPSAIEDCQSAYRYLSDYLANHPVITTEEEARAAKTTVDHVKDALGAMETERDGRVRPLNTKVAEINGEYKKVREPLEKLFNELRDRLNTFIEAERKRREKEAAEAARIAQENEQRARDAEAAEREAIDNAKAGEFTNVGAATAAADEAFADFQKSARHAARADKATNVRIGGGFGRALSQRSSETLVIEDPIKALAAIVKERNGELPEKLADAIKTAARDYRKAKGSLPEGVTATKSRSI